MPKIKKWVIFSLLIESKNIIVSLKKNNTLQSNHKGQF